MKPKTYPESITGKELEFIRSYLLNEAGRIKAPALKAVPKTLVEQLRVPELSSDNLSEHIFWRVNGLTDYPKRCITCNSPITKFHSFSRGYPHLRCSAKCSNSDTTVKQKKIAASISKYGTPFPLQSMEVKKKVRHKVIQRHEKTKQEVIELIKCQGFSVVAGETFSDEWVLTCECGHTFSQIPPTWSRWNTGWKTICPACSRGSSSQEKEIARFIENLGFTIERRNRTILAPLEIDIYIPELKLGVEFNGLYWHSDDKLRHKLKADAAKMANIKLIQIFEHEWDQRQEQVIARLKSALKLNTRIYARQTKLVSVTSRQAHDFFMINHLHGSANGGCNFYGLEKDGQLLQVISITKSRFSKLAPYELLRSATVHGVTVVGGLSKLIKHAVRIHGPMVTYADRCWGEGESYALAGGKFVDTTMPGYLWWKGNEILSRYHTQKRHINKLLGNMYDPNKSEDENMRAAGWRKLWNAGNSIYLFGV
jgi:hypothetical protein